MKFAIIGRQGSNYRKKIDEWLGNIPMNQAHAVFNYGLQGQKLQNFLNKQENQRLHQLPCFNLYQFGNKFQTVEAVRQAGMAAPMAWKYRDRGMIEDVPVIAKPYYSLGGKNIFRVDQMEDVQGRTHYLQEEITNRKYELRVHAAAWITPDKWLVQKRTHEGGNDVLAWNNHNGGKFQTVNDVNQPLFQRVVADVQKMLPLLKYQFGAADFIIQNNFGGPLKHWFIEWNLAPGWTMERTETWYRETFKKLEKLSFEEAECLVAGMSSNDVVDAQGIEHHMDDDADHQPAGRFRFRLRDLPPPMPDWVIAPENEQQRLPEGEGQRPIGNRLMGNVLEDLECVADALYEQTILDMYKQINCPNGHELLRLRNPIGTAYCPICGRNV